MIEITEKEEEEDSTGRNESIVRNKKNDFKNQSDIFCNKNKKLILKRNKKIEDESKNNANHLQEKKNVLSNKINDKINENRKDDMIFNNNILFRPSINSKKNKLNIINYIGSRNTGSILSSLKDNFSSYKKVSPFNVINRYEQLELKGDYMNDKTIGDNNNNKKISKVSLPNLNIGFNDNKRNLSSNNKYTKIKIAKSSSLTNSHNSIKNYSSQSHDHYNDLKNNIENEDNYKIDLLSTNSQSNNILIPIISSQNIINKGNYIEGHNKNENENTIKQINQNQKSIKNFTSQHNNTEENNKNNNINEINKLNNKSKSKNLNKKIFLDNNYNILMSIDHSFMAKLHKIKVEKGMMGNKFFEKINKNLLNNEYNHLATFENYTSNSKLPLINKIKE